MVEVVEHKRKIGRQYQLGLEPGERLVPGMAQEQRNREYHSLNNYDYAPVSYAYGTHDPYHEKEHYDPCHGVRNTPTPKSFSQAEEVLGSRGRRCVGNHTYVHRFGPSGGIGLTFHTTDVVIWRTDGATVLNSGGWQTKSTKDRINGALPRYSESTRLFLESKGGDWYLVKSRYDEPTPEYDSDGSVLREVGGGWTELGRWPFYDSITIQADGTVK